MELYKKYRPTTLDGVVGQDAVVKQIKAMGPQGWPHAALFGGASGAGKTTVARIIAGLLGCTGPDLEEINSASFRGIDAVREITTASRRMPQVSNARVYIIDEAHQLTAAAQDAALKLFEDTPPHVYIVVCTTEPAKLRPALRGRCTEFTFAPITAAAIAARVVWVAQQEAITLGQGVAGKIAQYADGSLRVALVALEQVAKLQPQDQLAAVGAMDSEATTRDLCLAIMRRQPWTTVANILTTMTAADGFDAERARRAVSGWFRACLLKAKQADEGTFLGHVLGCFITNVYDSGKDGFVHACYTACFPPR
jgi:DNA polymerase-3 subunit gamma/tau